MKNISVTNRPARPRPAECANKNNHLGKIIIINDFFSPNCQVIKMKIHAIIHSKNFGKIFGFI